MINWGGSKHYMAMRVTRRLTRRRERMTEKGRLYYKQFEDSPYGRFKNLRKAVWVKSRKKNISKEMFEKEIFTLTFEEFLLVWSQAGKVFCRKTKELQPAFDVKVSKYLKKDGCCITRIDRTKPYEFSNMTIEYYGKLLDRK